VADAVIDHDGDAALHIDRSPARDIMLASALNLLELPLGFFLDVARRHLDVIKSVLVEHHLGMSSIHHCAQAEFGVAGSPDLAHEDQVKRRPQSPSDFKGHWHAAARQRQDDRVLCGIDHQARDQLPPGIGPVPKAENIGVHGFSLLAEGAGRLGPAPGSLSG
jgi:hypothetical protein